MSLGNQIDLNSLTLSRTSVDKYEKLGNTDVLEVQHVQEYHGELQTTIKTKHRKMAQNKAIVKEL